MGNVFFRINRPLALMQVVIGLVGITGPFALPTRAETPATQVGSSPGTAPAAHPPLGVNLEFVADYSRSMVFVDAMKSARRFGSEQKPWDTSAPLDSHGWPTGDAGAVVMADAAVAVGEYHFFCIGYCTVEAVASSASVRSIGYDRATNTTRATVVVGAPTDHLFLGFKNTKGGIQNIKLIRPGYPATTKEVFTKEFLAAIAPFSTLRLMDFTRTNVTPVKEWNERPTPEDGTQSTEKGVAWEYAIALANQTGKDLWINVPDQASDDYVKQLATLLNTTLNKDRVVYVEYSNEVWNSMFPQSGHNHDAAKREVAAGNTLLTEGGKDNNEYYWGWKRVGERIVQIGQIFKGVMGDGALNTRFRPVLSSQSAYPFLVRMQIDFIRSAYGPPSKFIYGLAGAPYLGPDDNFKNRTDITLDQVFSDGIAKGMNWVKIVMMQYSMLARYYGIHSLCYEGGIALEGDASLATKIKSNYDPRMEKTVVDYLNYWYSTGGELFMYYNLCGSYSKHGCWGLTDDIRKKSPKMLGAIDVAKGPIPPMVSGRDVPSTLLAWQFDSNDGGKAEPSKDGGQNVGYIADGNSFDYLLNVKKAGRYSITVQTGSDQAGSVLELLANDTSLGTVKCPNTGNFQVWRNTPIVSGDLPAGPVVLRLKVVKKGMNIRSIIIHAQG